MSIECKGELFSNYSHCQDMKRSKKYDAIKINQARGSVKSYMIEQFDSSHFRRNLSQK